MSEGQRQLIKIVGMLGLYKNEDCLTLMDEPDAHMNPKWKYDMMSLVKRCLSGAVNTQALMKKPLSVLETGDVYVEMGEK